MIYLSRTFVSEGYCYLLDFMYVRYYPSTNRISNSSDIRWRFIVDISHNEAREMACFLQHQLHNLFIHLRISLLILDEDSRRVFEDKEGFLYYIAAGCYEASTLSI